MKKTLFLSLSLLIVGVLVWASGQAESTGGAPQTVRNEFENSWENYKEEPIVLDGFIDDANADPEIMTAYETLIPQLTREQTGVTLRLRTAADSSEQSMNLLIASQDYPDFMFVRIDRPYSNQLIVNDQIWAYDDLNEQYGIDVIRHMNVNQRFRLRSTFGMEKIYHATAHGYPDEYMDDPWVIRWQSGPYINEPLYQAVGAPPIQSMDDLIEVAAAIKAYNPRVAYPINVTRSDNRGVWGEPAEVVQLRMYYGLNDPTTYWTLGEPHRFYIQAPGFVELIVDLNRMVSEELISPVVWTGTNNDKLNNLFTGVAAIELNGDSDNFPWYNEALAEKAPGEYYVMLPPFDAEPGSYEFTAAGRPGAGGISGWAIPTANEDKLIRTAAFVDYMMSDEFQKLNFYGREGMEHDIVDGMPVLKPEIAELGGTDIGDEYYFNVLGGVIRNAYWAMVARQQRMPEMAEALDTLRPAIDEFHDLTFVPEAATAAYPEGSEELKIYSEIREVFGDEIVRIILGDPGDVRSDVADLLARIEDMGIGRLNAYQEQVARDFEQTVERFRF